MELGAIISIISLCLAVITALFLPVIKWWINQTNEGLKSSNKLINDVDTRLKMLENNHNNLKEVNGTQNNDIKNFSKELHDMTDLILKTLHNTENALKDQFREEINEIKKDFVSIQQFNSFQNIVIRAIQGTNKKE